MAEGRKMFFTADTHYGSERTLELSKRPFQTTEEMDDFMIQKWNEVIGPDDTVFHLGDFGDYTIKEKLNGRIVLILGNYERSDIEKGIVTRDELVNNYGFLDVVDHTYLKAEVTGSYILKLVHEPSKYAHKEDSIMTLFGHIHGRQMIKRFGLDVGVDAHHFQPVSLETVNFYLNAIKKHYDKEVFC